MKAFAVKLWVLLHALALGLSAQVPEFQVEHPEIDEQSAIVASYLYPDVFWVLEDSGSEPILFPLNSRGRIIVPDYLSSHYGGKRQPEYPGMLVLTARNLDWESLGHIKDTLIIADVGNNSNTRRDLGVYLVLEPNPHNIPQCRPFTFLPLAFPDQRSWPPEKWDFDCEAVFGFKGHIYFLTKHRSDQRIDKPKPSTKLYRMDTRHTNQVNVLTKVSEREDLGGWVTAADMSPDLTRLAMLVHNPLVSSIWLFPTPREGDDFLGGVPIVTPMTKVNQVEGICFKNADTLIVTNEQRDWYEIPLQK